MSKGYIVSKKGKGLVRENGSLSVFNSKGICPDCCCKPKVLATYTTNSSNRTWNLTQYQGDGVGPPGGSWRLRERGAGLTYGSGTINENGKLVGLPGSFTTNYSYDGYMQLEIGCPQQDGTIKWP